jgi:tetratricopeptide (TPR) repeat protein
MTSDEMKLFMPINSLTNYQKKVIIILLLIALTLAVYWQVQNFEFINYDDNLYVTQNYLTQSGLTGKWIIRAFTDTQTGNWHPLTMLSHMLDWELFGNNAGGHHWTSVIIHIFNVTLLFILLNTMTGALWRSAFVAALFAIHPMNVESVAWIAERKNVLSTFFWIFTMLFYVWYARHPCWTRYLMIFVSFCFGLMCKSMLVTLPFVLLLIDFWPLNRLRIPDQNEQSLTNIKIKKENLSFLLLEKIPLFIMSAVFAWITMNAQKAVNAFSNPEVMPLIKRIANAIVAYCLYIKKLFWPTDLTIFYPIDFIPAWKIFFSAAFLIFLTILAFKYCKKFPYIIVGWLWYLGTMIPVIGLIQVGRHSMADRYAYIPFIGLFIILAFAIPQFLSKLQNFKMYVFSVMIIFIIIMTGSSFIRTSMWQNTRTLFEDAIRINPRNYFAYNLLGLDEANAGRYEKALQYYHISLKINPNNDQAYNNAGNVFLILGKYPYAYNYYQKAIMINDKQAMAYYNLGVLMAVNNKNDQAVFLFKKTLSITPHYLDAYVSLGITLLKMGNIDEAIYYFHKVLSLDASNVAAKRGLKECMEMEKKSEY